MLLQSGVYQRDGECVRGPALDGDQTGYGPGYRIYEAATATGWRSSSPDEAAWRRLGALPEATSPPGHLRPLARRTATTRSPGTAEAVLEAAFATAPAAAWVARLRQLGPAGRAHRADWTATASARAILDDPVNRQLGRVASYRDADWGHFEQIGRAGAVRPAARRRAPT